MILQLDPPIPMVRAEDGARGHAYLVIDYGQEHDTLFLFGSRDTRELWWLPNSKLRLDDNVSLGRMPACPA